MPELTVYHLEPPEDTQIPLTVHFGKQGIGYEATVEHLSSDSLFAALVAEAVLLEGLASHSGDTPQFVKPFESQDGTPPDPPLRHSSLFPRIGSLVLLPRPALKLPIEDEEMRREIGKGFKKLRYVSPALFTQICQGKEITEMPIIMQGKKVWISQAEFDSVMEELATLKDTEWERKPGETDKQWHARLKAQPIWDDDHVPHVTVDRVTNASAFYEVGRVVFAPGCGLALLVQYRDETYRKRLELLLELLGDEGIGGKRSSGCGYYSLKQCTDTLSFPDAGKRVVLLSRYLPTLDEMPALRAEGASYQLVTVGGWLLSVGVASQRRQEITMVQEGSVLVPQAGREITGRVEDVRPATGINHPVYRSGLALTVPVSAGDNDKETTHA